MKECDKVRDQLAEHAVGALRGRRESRVEAHLRACEACRKELAALKRTGELLHTVGNLEAPPETWMAIRQAIGAGEQVRVTPGRRWAWVAATSVAALLLVLLGMFLLSPTGPSARPELVVAVEADEEMEATLQGHLSTAWGAPLADEAAVGLRLVAWENDG